MTNRSAWLIYLCLGLVGIAGALLILWMTPQGAGIKPDSTVYLEAAKSLLTGQGYSARGEELTHYPPLYPIFLAGVSLLEADLVQGARILNAVLFALTLVLVGLAVYLSTEHNLVATIAAPLTLLLSSSLLAVHTVALSEPLFIALSLAGIILLCFHVRRSGAKYLIAAALFLGLATATRYVGLAMLPATVAVLLLPNEHGPLRGRLRNTLNFLAVACAPLVFFMLRNGLTEGASTDRQLVFHLVSAATVIQFAKTLADLLIPSTLPPWFRVVILVCIVATFAAGLLIIIKRGGKDSGWRSMGAIISLCCLLFSASYSFFLFLSISLFDAQTPADARLLSPVFVWLIVGAFAAAWTLSRAAEAPAVWWTFLLLLLFTIVVRAPQAAKSAAGIRLNGQGYNSRRWRTSETMAYIKQLPEDARIYSNGLDAIAFLTTRTSLGIPKKVFPGTMETNSDYQHEAESLCNDVRTDGAYLVYFKRITWRWYLPSQVELGTICQLPVLHRFRDGTVYGEQ